MSGQPISLEGARILVSNDDGIDAPGIKVLEQIARSLSDDVWVVAPEANKSGAGHSLTLQRPLRIRQIDERHFAVDGTPTDCVLLAVNEILKDRAPTLVLSGINAGYNLGEDVRYSGTIAAAMEAVVLGVQAIALSQYFKAELEDPWQTPLGHAESIIRKLCAVGWPRDVVMSLNFPPVAPEAVKGVQATSQGRNKIGDEIQHGKDPRGKPYYWVGAMQLASSSAEGTDRHAVEAGYVSVTPVSLDATHYDTLAQLRETLS